MVLHSLNMAARNTFYVFLGLVIGVSFSLLLNSVYALSTTEISTISDEQNTLLKYTGAYNPIVDYGKGISINTYESICTGYYIVEETETAFRSVGFGDLADQYTYSYDKPIIDKTPSTTTEIVVDTVTDTIVPDNIILTPEPI